MKKKQTNQEDLILQLLNEKKLIRPRDLKPLGISRVPLNRLFAKKKIIRIGRGLYTKPEAIEEEKRSLIEVCELVPEGVICLLTALKFHDIGTQNPHQVWLAIDRKAKSPRHGNVKLRIVRFSGKALHFGIEEHIQYGTKIKVTNPAKTIADCFKYRNKIGLDVAIEALREGWSNREFTMDELYRAAKICRVDSIVRPYTEALI